MTAMRQLEGSAIEGWRHRDPRIVALLHGVLPAGEPAVQVELDSFRLIGRDVDAWLGTLGLEIHCGLTGQEVVLRSGGVEVFCSDAQISTGLVVLAATALEGGACPPQVTALSLRALAEELVHVRRDP